MTENNPKPIDDDKVNKLCKIGHGAATCSFLGMGGGKAAFLFVCLKGSALEASIVARREDKSINAMGDNCSGPPDFKPTET